jgi:apolipoprotein D and lipocalin family protein
VKALFALLFSFVASSSFADVQTVPSVDLAHYAGKWFEIAAIPQSFQKQCVQNTSAEYVSLEDGLIQVINSCEESDGSRSIAEGRAKIVDPATNAKLKVTFVKLIDWIFAFGGDYWVIDLAPDYHFAVVGHPTRDYGWILSRTPQLDLADLRGISERLKIQGYDTCKFLTTVQTGGAQSRQPLCEAVK